MIDKAALQVKYRDIDSLIPYARNSRTHNDEQVAQIAASIKEFGWTNPVLVDGENGIIAGHGRVLAARKLGFTEVPTIELAHLSDTQRRAYIIADNRLAEMAGWDGDMLKLEIEDLKLQGFDVDLTGFNDDDLNLIFHPDQPATTSGDTEPQLDKIEELREKWDVQVGQLWALGDHRLLCGDSTISEHVTKVLGDDRPHLMVTDPPYGVKYDADWRNRALRADGSPIGGRAIGNVINDDRADWREAWMLFHGDVAYVWHDGLLSALVADSLMAAGFNIRSQIIWGKQHFAIGRGDYHWRHEPCWYAVRKSCAGHWQGDRTQSTLWEIQKPQKSETGHSTQKPLECMERPIRNNSANGDCIYEPFSGSGTTIIACENLGRKCRAIELSPGYVAVAIQRWADHTGKTPKLI